jgi:hypothetical protein
VTDAQTLLWTLPTSLGPFWWIICMLFSAPAAMLMVLYMIMRHPFNALLVARLMILGSLLMFALIPLNSGWMPWGVMMASAGGLFTTFLIASHWCERKDPWGDALQWLQGIRHILHPRPKLLDEGIAHDATWSSRGESDGHGSRSR